MRVIIFCLTVILTTALLAQENQMSLDDCIEYALKNNEQTKIAKLEKRISDAEVRKTIGTGLPQVEVTSGLNYNFEPQKSLIDISTFDPSVPAGTEQEVSFQQDYDGNMALSVKQLIFDGSFFVGLQASRTYKELTTKEHIETEIDVVEAVSKAYYTVLINQERLELLEKNFQRLDTLLKETKALNENGFAEKIDVDRVRVNYNNLRVEKNKLARLLEVSKKLLKFQMGMSLSKDIQLNDALNDLTMQPVQQTESISYEDRIEYSQLQTNEDLVNLDIKNNHAQYLPKLYASFNYGFNTATSDIDLWLQGNRWLSFGTVGVSLTIPIFDGFIKSNRIQQNRIQLQQIEQQKNMLQKNIDLEIEQAEIDLSASLENLDVQQENMELAREIYDITIIKYNEGVGSNLEVMEADADLKEAQTNYYNAMFNAVVAQIELKKALGTLHNQQ